MEVLMKAIVQSGYGTPEDVLSLQDIDIPNVGDDEVLIRVRAASVHPDIWHVVNGLPYALRLMGAGLRKPKSNVPGTDVAGIVESVGTNVTRFHIGDEVFGECIRGHQWTNGGSYAEYVSAPEDALAHKPNKISFEQAASVPTSGLIALMNLRDMGQIRAGHNVLVNGAGGGVGSVAVQLAKSFGTVVTGVDCAAKLDMIRSLGADHAIDYAVEDFTQSSVRYDLIFDIPGNHPFSECKRALSPTGKYVIIGHDRFGNGIGRWLGNLPRFFKLVVMGLFVKQLPSPTTQMTPRNEMMFELKELFESEELTPIIDRTFPLSEASQAIQYLEESSVLGRIVIAV
jgi:NADPH:quinone reductase-like Zn-dependent oxidoreductase